MKNKIVFSTIAALALSTSAFGAFSYDFSADGFVGKSWQDHINDGSVANGVSINTLVGWDATGKTKLGNTIGGTTAITGKTATTIVGAFVSLTEKTDGTTTNDTTNTYYAKLTDLVDLTNFNNSLQVKENTAKTDTTKALQDYMAIQAQLDKVKAVETIYSLAKDQANVTGTSFELKDSPSQAELATLAKITIQYGKNTKTLTALLNTDGTYKADEIVTELKTAFESGQDLAAYTDNANLKKATADKDKLTQALEAIKTDVTTLASAVTKDTAKLAHVQAQLKDALDTFDNYKANLAKLEDQSNKIIQKQHAVLSSVTAHGDSFTIAAIKGSLKADGTTTAADMKDTMLTNIQGVAKDKLDNDTRQVTAGDEASYKPNATKITLTDALEVSKKIVSGDISDTGDFNGYADNVGDESKAFKDAQALQDCLQGMVDAIANKQPITATEAQIQGIVKIFTKKPSMGGAADGDSIVLTKAEVDNYNAAIKEVEETLSAKFGEIDTAHSELETLKSSLSTQIPAVITAKQEATKALGNELAALASTDAGVSSAMNELSALSLIKDSSGNTVLADKNTIETKIDAMSFGDIYGTISSDAIYKEYGLTVAADKIDDVESKKALKQAIANKYAEVGVKLVNDELVYNGIALTGTNVVEQMKTIAVNHHNHQIQTAANKVASAVANAKKDSLAVEGLSTLNIQLNNMNKRLGEIRGLDGEIGVWLRTWGGKMSADNDSFKYYSTQLGADKKTSMKDGDLYLGVLVGYDNVKSDIKSNAYSVGAYASYIDNSGFFADGVMKFVSTKNERSGFDLSNQQTLLASIEGGYRFDMSDGFYVEPSLEFVTGHVGEYKSKEKGSETTLKVDSFTPVVFKPQVFVGGSADAFTYRAGIGGVLSMQGQDASVEIANIAHNLNDAQVDGSSTIKLSKNNHGFASIGGSFKASENFRINLGVERSFGGDLTNDYEVNMTLRYGF